MPQIPKKRSQGYLKRHPRLWHPLFVALHKKGYSKLAMQRMIGMNTVTFEKAIKFPFLYLTMCDTCIYANALEVNITEVLAYVWDNHESSREEFFLDRQIAPWIQEYVKPHIEMKIAKDEEFRTENKNSGKDRRRR